MTQTILYYDMSFSRRFLFVMPQTTMCEHNWLKLHHATCKSPQLS